MGPNDLFYANAVGAFGAVSAGGNWDRLASAPNRWSSKLVENNEVHMLLFPDDTLVLAGSEIPDESLLVVISP